MRLLLLTALLALWTAAPAATPGGLTLNPVRLDLQAQQRGGAVTLTNDSAQRRAIEVEVMAWSQPEGEEQYRPTADLLVNPPLFYLEPGASRVVRIGRPAAQRSAPTQELTYRVYFREVLPKPTATDQALRVALRLGIPVFIASEKPGHSDLRWQLQRREDGSLNLRADNRGSLHARAADVRIADAAGNVVARAEGFRYLLAGAWQQWRLPATELPSATDLRVVTLTETGVREYPLEMHTDL